MTERYVWVDDAAKMLGVNRSTLYYYTKALKIEHKKFPLDRRKYISEFDLERIRITRLEAVERSQQTAELEAVNKPDAA